MPQELVSCNAFRKILWKFSVDDPVDIRNIATNFYKSLLTAGSCDSEK